MDYEKMLFYPNSSKMPQTNTSHNCLAPPPNAATFKVGQAVTNLFLQPLEPYSTYADNFDLSLLPQDCSSPTENIPTTVYQYTNNTSGHSSLSSSPPPQIKIEQAWSSNATADDIKQEPSYTLLYDQVNHHHQQQQQSSSPNQLIPPPAYPHIYPSPQSSPAQSEYGFPHTQFPGCYDSLSSSRTSLYPESPCPSLDAASIKQELHILPPSPPESNCEAPSPHSLCSDIKSEPFDADVETTLIDLNSLLEEPYNELTSKKEIDLPTPPQDYQLLREYLEDTTFQKKHNLKPLALESFIGGLEEVRGDIEPVISLALEHAKREADATCAKLQISQDPSAWSALQVHAWLRSTIAQFRLPQIEDLESKFSEDGAALILLSDEEFTRRAPEIGSTLHAQLEIWKLAYADGYQSPVSQPQVSNEGNLSGSMPQSMWSADGLQSINMDLEDESEDDEELLPSTSSAVTLNADIASSTPTTIAGATTQTKRPAGAPGRTGGSHIHLWQFLKELLASPHINGTAIRWIDRSKGIFKIEDSVRVAKLWGKRKNRPAMNYDKLSRSIRQYYKKGIMKKTERSQRLVYQFCHPYHL